MGSISPPWTVIQERRTSPASRKRDDLSYSVSIVEHVDATLSVSCAGVYSIKLKSASYTGVCFFDQDHLLCSLSNHHIQVALVFASDD